MGGRSPQFQAIKEALTQTNGNAKAAFDLLCKKNGKDPNTLAQQALLQMAGIPNINQLLSNAMSSNPEIKELASMIK